VLIGGLCLKQSRFLCLLGDNLQTAITVAKNSEMIPPGSQIIIVEANEPEELIPASVTWQLVQSQEMGPRKNVSKCRSSPALGLR
jgi:cation-transporting ATPase 13A3/4/5